MKQKIRWYYLCIPVVVALGIGLLRGWKPDVSAIPGGEAAAMRRIEAEPDEEKQFVLMKKLTFRVGPKKAIELLNASNLPKAGRSHLLSHKIGEAAYELYKEDALAYCPEDVRSGCSHGLLTVAISDIGLSGVKRMVARCKSWSPFTYTMCLHAAGHAFTALYAYDVPKALTTCDELFGDDEFVAKCWSGSFMENAHGVHDGLIPPLHPYLSYADPLKPCNIVSEKYRLSCYYNQAGWWYADVFERDLEKTVSYCSNVPKEYYGACVDNVARVISTVTNNDLGGVRKSCGLFDKTNRDECVKAIAVSVFVQGDIDLPFVFCSNVEAGDIKRSCYQRLADEMRMRNPGHDEMIRFCSKFEAPYRDLCFSL